MTCQFLAKICYCMCNFNPFMPDVPLLELLWCGSYLYPTAQGHRRAWFFHAHLPPEGTCYHVVHRVSHCCRSCRAGSLLKKVMWIFYKFFNNHPLTGKYNFTALHPILVIFFYYLLHIYNYDVDLLKMSRVNARNMRRISINVLYVNK